MDKRNPVVKAARDLRAFRIRRGRAIERAKTTYAKHPMCAEAPKPCYGLWEERAT